jgi:hypothetical protein
MNAGMSDTATAGAMQHVTATVTEKHAMERPAVTHAINARRKGSSEPRVTHSASMSRKTLRSHL